MIIKISKIQWENIGKKAGWIKKAVTEEDIIRQKIFIYPLYLVLQAIKSLKMHGIMESSIIPKKEIYYVLAICSLEELNEILSYLEKVDVGLEV